MRAGAPIHQIHQFFQDRDEIHLLPLGLEDRGGLRQNPHHLKILGNQDLPIQSRERLVRFDFHGEFLRGFFWRDVQPLHGFPHDLLHPRLGEFHPQDHPQEFHRLFQ